MRARPPALIVLRFLGAMPLASNPEKAPAGRPRRTGPIALPASNVRARSRRAISSSIAANNSEACIHSPWRQYRRDQRAYKPATCSTAIRETSTGPKEEPICGSIALRSAPFITPVSAAAGRRSPRGGEPARSGSAASTIRIIPAATGNSVRTADMRKLLNR